MAGDERIKMAVVKTATFTGSRSILTSSKLAAGPLYGAIEHGVSNSTTADETAAEEVGLISEVPSPEKV